jgi:hypothetical protein
VSLLGLPHPWSAFKLVRHAVLCCAVLCSVLQVLLKEKLSS